MNEPTTNRSEKKRSGQRWALVLAAGEGSRLGHLTQDPFGRSTPKQFCTVTGGPTLLQETLERGARLVGSQRVVAIVASQHNQWWRQDTSSLPQDNVVVQPRNRGTAAGILFPLLRIARRDPEARVAVLPSDHFVEREAVLESAIRSAFVALERERDAVVLLGITPERPDPELGWIVPATARPGRVGRVERFVEKPPLASARRLQRQGGLWNSFIFVARVASLLDLYAKRLPGLLEQLGVAVGWDAWRPVGAVESAYRSLETRDFSRELLEPSADALRVLQVPACGWSDLGTPERLARCAAAFGPVVAHPAGTGSLRPVLAAVV